MRKPKKWGGRQVARARESFGQGPLTCAICEQPIERWRKYPDPMSLSVDHAVPRSRGGRNAKSNLRPAHLRCNSSRGNREMPSKVAATSSGTLPTSKEWF